MLEAYDLNFKLYFSFKYKLFFKNKRGAYTNIYYKKSS